MQGCSIYIANALEILQSCSKPWCCSLEEQHDRLVCQEYFMSSRGWVWDLDNFHPRHLVPRISHTEDNSYPRKLIRQDNPCPRQLIPQENSYPRQLIPQSNSYPRQLIPQDNSYPRQLIPQKSSYPGQPIPNRTCTQDDSYPERWDNSYGPTSHHPGTSHI